MQRYFILPFMNSFRWLQFKDYLTYYMLRPHRNGYGISNLEKELSFLCKTSNLQILHLKRIKHLRKSYLKNNIQLTFKDLGAGSRAQESKTRTISEITCNAASSNRKIRLLYQLASNLQPTNCIELGTSLGIGTMALSLACPQSKIYTIEGSPELHNIAVQSFKTENLGNIEPLCGNFDSVLPSLLKSLPSVDMVFIDGNHTYEATRNYFNLILPFVNANTVVIFDDIRWSEGMFLAWQEICRNPQSSVTLDLLDIGIVFTTQISEKQHWKVYF